jgi:hypothetical protein
MKPYEEIDFPNGFLRWVREDGMYGCTLTEEQMVKIKAIHEAPRTWVGLTGEEIEASKPTRSNDAVVWELAVEWAEAKLKEKNT